MYINGMMILRGQGPDGARRTAASSFESKGVDRNGSDTWLVCVLNTSSSLRWSFRLPQMNRDPVLDQKCVNLSDDVWDSSSLRLLQVR